MRDFISAANYYYWASFAYFMSKVSLRLADRDTRFMYC